MIQKGPGKTKRRTNLAHEELTADSKVVAMRRKVHKTAIVGVQGQIRMLIKRKSHGSVGPNPREGLNQLRERKLGLSVVSDGHLGRHPCKL